MIEDRYCAHCLEETGHKNGRCIRCEGGHIRTVKTINGEVFLTGEPSYLKGTRQTKITEWM